MTREEIKYASKDYVNYLLDKQEYHNENYTEDDIRQAFEKGAMFANNNPDISSLWHDVSEEPANRVHFYVARDKDGRLWLYIGKPIRTDVEFQTKYKKAYVLTHYLNLFGLKYEDYAYLKWEDEPVEVFINMEEKL